MEVIAFFVLWAQLGNGVLFVAFSGGPRSARRNYLTGGNRLVRLGMPILFVAAGLIIPALIIGARGEALGSQGELASKDVGDRLERGRELFISTCKTCHSLQAAQAKGVTGPDLDAIGEMSKQRVTEAIRNGGTGQNRMPRGLLDGEQAETVGEYVAATAGR